MGPELPPPPRVFPPDEFDDWLDPELPARSDPTSAIWRLFATLLFVDSLVFCAYAVKEHHWWLWVGMLVPLAVVLAMAAQAVRNMERSGELGASERAWNAYPNQPR